MAPTEKSLPLKVAIQSSKQHSSQSITLNLTTMLQRAMAWNNRSVSWLAAGHTHAAVQGWESLWVAQSSASAEEWNHAWQVAQQQQQQQGDACEYNNNNFPFVQVQPISDDDASGMHAAAATTSPAALFPLYNHAVALVVQSARANDHDNGTGSRLGYLSRAAQSLRTAQRLLLLLSQYQPSHPRSDTATACLAMITASLHQVTLSEQQENDSANYQQDNHVLPSAYYRKVQTRASAA